MARWSGTLFLSFLIIVGGIPVVGAPEARAKSGLRNKGDDIYGEWRNVKGRDRSIRHISIRPAGSGAKVHVWGDCGSRICDWGVQRAVVYKGDPKARGEPKTAVHVKFDLDKGVRYLILMRNPRNEGLVAQVFNRDRSGRGFHGMRRLRSDTYSIERFWRTGKAPVFASRRKSWRDRREDGRHGGRDRRYSGADARFDVPELWMYGREMRDEDWGRYGAGPGEDFYGYGEDLGGEWR
jgi:hypothetical protein